MSAVDMVVELEVLDGLVPFVIEELGGLRSSMHVTGTDATSVRVRGRRDDLRRLHRLRTAVAVYLVSTFEVPRPKSLLGEQHLRRLIDSIDEVRGRSSVSFGSFRVSAAGRDSTVFGRLTDEIAKRTGLTHDADDGELLIRVRPSAFAASGWDVLVRTTLRPLSTRAWRVENYRGALNATIAAAMVDLSEPSPDDRVFNPMCGSGTLLIERLAVVPPATIVGCDNDPDALSATRANLGGAKARTPVELWNDDATALTRITEPAFDRVLVDLPWGTLVGTHDDNAELYPAFLTELARVTMPDAVAVILTHEIKLFQRTVAVATNDWTPTDEVRVFQKGHHPRAYVLHRNR